VILQATNIKLFKQKALAWANTFDTVCCLDSNNYADPYGKFDTLIAVGVKDELTANAGDAFKKLEDFRKDTPGFITGFLGYDLKNELEMLSSQNTDHLDFPDLYFFSPQIVITIKDNDLEIIGYDPIEIFKSVDTFIIPVEDSIVSVNLKARFCKDEYINSVNQIKKHIARGDLYVTNFCQEFYAEQVIIDPLALFKQLNGLSPTPFSTYFKWKGNYILCASPERFLAKRGSKLVSQPIKGTARRDKNAAVDQSIRQGLRNHPKELQENVMIVDLVRNDLTKSARPGTVKTEELFGVRSFEQVHQMVSTVVCELRADVSAVQSVRNTFPMGSMTGAPKVSAMQLMEKFERSKRGVYSGAVGYFGPDDDFDFNVVIRTILYNSAEQFLSFHVGSAITYHADAAMEYDECLLKAKAILEVLDQPPAYPQF